MGGGRAKEREEREKTAAAETARRWKENPVTSVTSGSVKAVRKKGFKDLTPEEAEHFAYEVLPANEER